MAEYVKSSFESAFREDPNKRFTVVNSPEDETIVYLFAITELIAAKAHIIEVIVYDGGTSELLVAWADREQDRTSLFSFSDFSWFSHARATVDN